MYTASPKQCSPNIRIRIERHVSDYLSRFSQPSSTPKKIHHASIVHLLWFNILGKHLTEVLLTSLYKPTMATC
uniref:Uncharacterized protein n=1 Tax=Arundo donax TaxID=35708 RepID=A0A0A9HC43_ARUDO